MTPSEYWRSISSCIDIKLLEKYKKRINKVLFQLANGETKSADLDQKKWQLWTVKINKKIRLIFTEFSSGQNEKPDLYLLVLMENHKYEQALPAAENLQCLVREDGVDAAGFRPYLIMDEAIDLEEVEIDDKPFREPVRFFRENFFQLNQEQGALIQVCSSFIAYGKPGAGKSSSALFLVEQIVQRQIADHQISPIVILADTPRQLEQMRRDWEPFCLLTPENSQGQVQFMLAQKFIEAIFLKQEKTIPEWVSYQKFEQAYAASMNIKNNKKFNELILMLKLACKIPLNVKDEGDFICRALYQELCLLAPWGAYEEGDISYIGEKNSYFKVNEYPQIKAEILEILTVYRDLLVKNNQSDMALSLLPEFDHEKYAHIVLDEGQNTPLNAFKSIIQSAVECSAFMDDNQNTRAPKSNILLKKQLFEQVKSRVVPIYRLSQGHRCSVAVNKAAHSILELRDHLSGISPEVFSQEASEEQGIAHLYAIENATEEPAALVSIRTQLEAYKETEVVIITWRDKEEVRKMYGNDYMICHADEVPGLEFDCVVLENPLGTRHKNNHYVHANQRWQVLKESAQQKTAKSSVPHSLKHATISDDPQFTQALQTLYMAITRARKTVIVRQLKADWNASLLETWEEGFSSELLPADEVEENIDFSMLNLTTERDWERRLAELIAQPEADLKQIQQLTEKKLYLEYAESERWGMFVEHLEVSHKFSNLSGSQKDILGVLLSESWSYRAEKFTQKIDQCRTVHRGTARLSKLLTIEELGNQKLINAMLAKPKSVFLMMLMISINPMVFYYISEDQRIAFIDNILTNTYDPEKVKRCIDIILRADLFKILRNVNQTLLKLINFLEGISGDVFQGKFMWNRRNEFDFHFLDVLLDIYINKKDDVDVAERLRRFILVGINQQDVIHAHSFWIAVSALEETQAVFLKFLEAGVIKDVSQEIDVDALALCWDIAAGYASSALSNLLQSDTGCLILNKLISMNERIGALLFQKSWLYLLLNTKVTALLVPRIAQLGRCVVLVSLIKNVDFIQPKEALFMKNLLDMLTKEACMSLPLVLSILRERQENLKELMGSSSINAMLAQRIMQLMDKLTQKIEISNHYATTFSTFHESTESARLPLDASVS